jgi:hypothetical protein
MFLVFMESIPSFMRIDSIATKLMPLQVYCQEISWTPFWLPQPPKVVEPPKGCMRPSRPPAFNDKPSLFLSVSRIFRRYAKTAIGARRKTVALAGKARYLA